MKVKTIITALLCLVLLVVPSFAKAKENEKVKVYIFHGDTCPHCHELLDFFSEIEEEYGDMYELVKYEVWTDKANAELMKKVMRYLKLNPEKQGVPFYIIGEEVFDQGYSSSHDADIISAIEYEYMNAVKVDLVAEALKEKDNTLASITIMSSIGVFAGLVIYARVKNKKK